MTNLDDVLKSRDIALSTKFCIIKAMVFPIVRYSCESWTMEKAECRKIYAFELCCWRTLESPLNCREIKPVNPKGNQPWIFTWRADAKGEAPILWPPDVKSLLIGKDPVAGKDWGWEEKREAEDEMVGQHHWQEIVKNREAWHTFVDGIPESWTQLSIWMTTIMGENSCAISK